MTLLIRPGLLDPWSESNVCFSPRQVIVRFIHLHPSSRYCFLDTNARKDPTALSGQVRQVVSALSFRCAQRTQYCVRSSLQKTSTRRPMPPVAHAQRVASGRRLRVLGSGGLAASRRRRRSPAAVAVEPWRCCAPPFMVCLYTLSRTIPSSARKRHRDFQLFNLDIVFNHRWRVPPPRLNAAACVQRSNVS